MTEQIGCPTLRPTLRMLSDEQIRAIHNASLDILAGAGIEMRHEGARTLLLDAGAWQMGDRIMIPEHLVMGALRFDGLGDPRAAPLGRRGRTSLRAAL
jgi:trimethylamine:corrinoid methyltransferase-like protein